MTDWELLQKYSRDGSREAMDELVRRHAEMVYGAALREMRDGNAAEDVTQATFMVLMRRAGSISEKVVLGGWLFKVARYAAADARRAKMRQDKREQEAGKMRSEVVSDKGEPEIEPLLNEAIGSLGRADRDVVVMKYLQERSFEEVAAALGTTEGTARQRLSRAMGKMRSFLAGRGVMMSEGAFAMALAAAAARRAPSGAVERMVSKVLSGAGSAASVSLTEGVLRMMFWEKAKIGLVAATVVAAIAGLAVLPMVKGEGPGAAGVAAAAPAAGQPAATEGPKTPKEAVIGLFHAMEAGDEEGLVKGFVSLTPAQELSIRQTAQVSSALKGVRAAIVEKFGADAATQLAGFTSTGVSEADINGGVEVVDGEMAIVDIGTGPGKIPLQKVDGVWKVDQSVMQHFSSGGMAMMVKKVPQMKALTEDIKAGKYESGKAAMDALKHVFMPPRPRPKATMPAETQP